MIILDLETTGLDPLKNQIIEIGALDFENPSNQFYQTCKIDDTAEVDPAALEINGYNYSNLTDTRKMSLKQIILNFKEWLKSIDDKTIAGQNVDFDITFLNVSFKRFNANFALGRRKIDLHSLTYSQFKVLGLNPPLKDGFSNLSGDHIMEYVGLPKEPRPHTAMNGVKYEAEAFSRLIYKQSLLKEFQDYKLSFL